MKKILIFLLAFCLCHSFAGAQDNVAVASPTADDSLVADTVAVSDSLPWTVRLRQRLDSLVASPLLERSQLGLMVYDLTDDSTLYTYGHRQTLRPASTMKLLTAITGIETLGADFQMKTSLYYTGTVSGGTLRGNLVSVGGMDPLFDRNDLAAFISKVRHAGIDTIRGRLLADVTMKDDDRWGEGWCWDDDNYSLTPLLYNRKDDFLEALRRELRRDGVVIVDTFYSSMTPSQRQRHFVCSRSHGIGELLVPMMKDSDNLFAECLFYLIAANTEGRPAKGKQAANQVKRMIQRVGLNPGDYRVADGSGLSLYNYVSAELEVRLLRYAWRHREIFDLLLASLPIAGVDGTLASRMAKGPAAGNVRAKTGTVSGISSLAGYCKAPNGHTLAFCIINQGIMRMADGRGFQDSVCAALVKSE